MAKIKEIIDYLDAIAPPSYQESYDNAGLLTGDAGKELTGILICLDSTEPVIEEAIVKKCNLIIAHHPIIFKGLRKITGSNYVERVIIQAIKRDIAIYAVHTNLDNLATGVNRKIAEKLSLINPHILSPRKDVLCKLITFIPVENTIEVLNAVHKAGAGTIGNYDHCSFRVTGTGRFKPNPLAQPHIGRKNQMEEVVEDRVEMIFPSHLEENIIKSLKEIHPYEEVAYYLHKLENRDENVGSGMIGELDQDYTQKDFLEYLKNKMDLEVIKYTPANLRQIRKVAICGGAGSFLLPAAKASGAHAFITSDFKYHEYFDSEGKILIADIGHYESEVFTKELIYTLLKEKFSNIAPCLSEVNTNPIRYTRS